MNEWSAVDQALVALIASGPVEVREDGEWLPEFAQFRWEFRGEGAHALIHLWSEGRNLTRRIVGVREQSSERIVLEVHRFGKRRPSKLAFLHRDTQRAPKLVSREQFRSRIERFLLDCFPDASISGITASPNLKHSFSSQYVRGVMHESCEDWALLAVPSGEKSAGVEASLAFGLIWLDAVRSPKEGKPVRGLRLFVPEGAGRTLCERSLALSPVAFTEIFEVHERDHFVEKLDQRDVGNLKSSLVPRSQVDSLLSAAREDASRVAALSNASSEVREAIQQRALPGGTQAIFAFRGLEFARWSAEGFSFGMGKQTRQLDKASEPALSRLLGQLHLNRNSLASETEHPLYKRVPERWLETLIREDPTKLDGQLDPRFLYSQIPALTSGDRGVLDLLGVTRRGRLVVIELKASEDIQLPMQAIDYWLRVRRHQQEGTFQHYGYFPGLELDPKPPLVWLVAPCFRFHSSSEILLKYLSPEIGVTRIGLNENWRKGIRVLFRH